MSLTLMTLDQVRARVETAVPDADLTQLADDCESTITKWAGPLAFQEDVPETVTETLYAHRSNLLRLTQEPASIVSVTDWQAYTDTLLVEGTDYRIRGEYLEPVIGGYGGWGDHTIVTYVPKDSRYLRRQALVKLIQLELNFQPGFGSQQAGPWAERYSEYAEQKQMILNEVYTQDLFA